MAGVSGESDMRMSYIYGIWQRLLSRVTYRSTEYIDSGSPAQLVTHVKLSLDIKMFSDRFINIFGRSIQRQHCLTVFKVFRLGQKMPREREGEASTRQKVPRVFINKFKKCHHREVAVV